MSDSGRMQRVLRPLLACAYHGRPRRPRRREDLLAGLDNEIKHLVSELLAVGVFVELMNACEIALGRGRPDDGHGQRVWSRFAVKWWSCWRISAVVSPSPLSRLASRCRKTSMTSGGHGVSSWSMPSWSAGF